MSGEMSNQKPKALKGDLVICLDTGSIGVVIDLCDENEWMISFPHGNYPLASEDFDVLKSR